MEAFDGKTRRERLWLAAKNAYLPLGGLFGRTWYDGVERNRPIPRSVRVAAAFDILMFPVYFVVCFPFVALAFSAALLLELAERFERLVDRLFRATSRLPIGVDVATKITMHRIRLGRRREAEASEAT